MHPQVYGGERARKGGGGGAAFAISRSRRSGVRQWRQVSMPSPPALATPMQSSAEPVAVIPPHTIGCSIPSISVATVLILGRWYHEHVHNVGRTAVYR